MRLQHAFLHWGRCPQTPGIYRVVARMASTGTGSARPQAIPAAGPALGSHPCVALSSAQVSPGWTTSTSPCNNSAANGDYPLNFVSHSRGSLQVVAAITRSRLDEGLPPPIVDLHPDRPDQRGTMTPAGTLVLLNPEPTFEAIESAGGRVTKHAEAHVLAGFFFVSGEIERVTSYEAGFVGHHTVRDGHTVPDPLILDERFLAARVRGRGVSVLSSCSHAGVVNAALGALGAFGGEPIDVILGGYHLAGEGMEPRIEPTVHDLANRVRPRVVAPGHCTGWRAKAALAHTFAPGNYGPSVVGSLYALRAT